MLGPLVVAGSLLAAEDAVSPPDAAASPTSRPAVGAGSPRSASSSSGSSASASSSPGSPALEPGSPALEPGSPALEFQQQEFPDVRDGSVALSWGELAGVASYEVTAADGRVYYRGALPQAFISGLPDGNYEFQVRGFNAQADPVAISDRPARVKVEHWPLTHAVVLLLIGLTVVLSIIAVIVRGAWTSRGDAWSTPRVDGGDAKAGASAAR